MPGICGRPVSSDDRMTGEMRHILAQRQGSTLAHFAASNVLLAFDYDGTLAPIASRPADARLRRATRRLLKAVAIRYPCVVISGRGQRDVTRLLSGIPVWAVFGNHGLEPLGERPAYAQRVRDWIARLEQRLTPYPGVALEDKTYSLTVHYRQARSKRRMRKTITEMAARLPGSRVMGGRQAVNIVPNGAPHKGMALETARRLLACDYAIYVGDDDTDEDVFSESAPERVLSVRVGRARASAAGYYLKGQHEIDELLRILLRLRPPRALARPG
jgi:trehalose 6-phosphate phosphatase